MGFFERLRVRITRRGDPPHTDRELELRLPAQVRGEPLMRSSMGLEGLDEYERSWYGGVCDAIDLAPRDFSLARAVRVDRTAGITAARYRNRRPRNLQGLLDKNAWGDRQIAGGDVIVELGGVPLTRGVVGEQSLELRPDGSFGLPEDTAIDRASIHYDVIRGDTWFSIFAAEDTEWVADAARAIRGYPASSASKIAMELPDGWSSTSITNHAGPELADRIEAAVVASETAQDRWVGTINRLRPDEFQPGFLSGTRFVAVDLDPASLEAGPIRVEVWEYLTPYESLDQELAAEVATIEDMTLREARRVDLPAGSAARMTIEGSVDEKRFVIDAWFVRAEASAFQLVFLAGSASEAQLRTFEGMARSFRASATPRP